MYFVRVPQDSKSTGIVAITPDNTFCFCERCGGVFPVNLEDFVGDENFSLSEPDLLCDRCSAFEEVLEQTRRFAQEFMNRFNAKEEEQDE